ncbi:Pvc16 family protein [Cryobacterium tagatosivorans]|nr:Pvc16 family protein [Cryobacterium tagatosivorans]
MSALTNYGQAIAATTTAIQELLASPPIGLQVTARTPHSTRVGVSGPSLNLFLYSDGLISYREESVRHGQSRMIAELHYLVTAYPGDDADTDAASHQAYGTARAAIERHPVLAVPVAPGDTLQVWLTPTPMTVELMSALWLAFASPLQLSFAMMAAFTLDASEGPAMVGTIRDVVSAAGAGKLAVFSGPDDAAKHVGAVSVAQALGKPILEVPLDQIVSAYLVETEGRLAKLFAQPQAEGAVLLITEADSLFGIRPEALDIQDPYADVDVAQVLELLARAPGPVIIAIQDSIGPELADRAAVEVQFPPVEPEPQAPEAPPAP